jgi:hypothetical protein
MHTVELTCFEADNMLQLADREETFILDERIACAHLENALGGERILRKDVHWTIDPYMDEAIVERMLEGDTSPTEYTRLAQATYGDKLVEFVLTL